MIDLRKVNYALNLLNNNHFITDTRIPKKIFHLDQNANSNFPNLFLRVKELEKFSV